MADGVPQLRDDDLSIPVLADILEPGDPAKADPGVLRRHIDHAWTDALIRDAHAEPLGAVPMLNDILVPGDPARAQHVPQPAGAGLTIPLLTEVLSHSEAHEDHLHDETSGAPIPLLTDVIADFDDAGAGSEAVEEAPSTEAFAFEVDDVPLLTDVFTDEVAPVEQHAAPVWHEVADTEEPVAASGLSTSTSTSTSEPVSHAQRELSALASSIEANLLDSELPFRAYCAFPGELALTAIDVGDSAVPPSWPMAKVPQPFGSGEPPELPALDSTVPETFANEAPVHAVTEPESTETDGVTTHPVPFESIATEVLPEAEPQPSEATHPVPFEPVANEVLPEVEPQSPEATHPVSFEPVANEVLPEVEPQPLEAMLPEATQPEVMEPEAVAPAMAEAEADHLAAMLAHPEPVAAELTEPQPEYLSDLALVPAQVEMDHVAADVRARALRYLASEGHALIESRCQEQAVWLAHRITREIAATLEREIGQWVQDALNDALTKRLPPR
jgi:hypothetical protein